jgi:hypothetical protein
VKIKIDFDNIKMHGTTMKIYMGCLWGSAGRTYVDIKNPKSDYICNTQG